MQGEAEKAGTLGGRCHIASSWAVSASEFDVQDAGRGYKLACCDGLLKEYLLADNGLLRCCNRRLTFDRRRMWLDRAQV